VEEPAALAWRKTRYSIANGDCVEVASTGGSIAVRDSKNPAGPVVRYAPGTWQTFLAATRRGDYDHSF
jgi:Domain of unknown function (DUF397)